MVSEKTTSTSGLSNVLERLAVKPHTRVIGYSHGSFLEQGSSPVLERILEGIPKCEPGKTYIVVLRSQNGKTTAAMDVVVNHLEDLKRHGLYLNAGRSLDIVPSLQMVLNTTVDGNEIVDALVSALGISQAGKGMAASLLFLDEVNNASDKEGEGRSNGSFVQYLFQSIAREKNMVGVILTSKPTVANYLLGLNGGKIRPFPGLGGEDWEAKQNKILPGWTDIDWTEEQLQALLAFKVGAVINNMDTSFLVAGMTPGDAVSRAKLVLSNRLAEEPTTVV
jgi:hypothetical protein